MKKKDVLKTLSQELMAIASEVVQMKGNQEIHKESMAIMTKRTPKGGNSFIDFIEESYAASMVMAVCRQVDRNPQSVSLFNLLNKLLQADITTLLTKRWYLSKYPHHIDFFPGDIERKAKEDFEDNFGLKDFVDPDIIRRDLNELMKMTTKISLLRNKRIAHKDSNKKLILDVSYNDLDRAIEIIRQLTSKYYLLLTGNGNNFTPTDSTNWQKIFT